MRVINTLNSFGDPITLTKEQYLERWEYAGLDSVIDLAVFARHFDKDICDELKTMQNRLETIKAQLVKSEFNQTSVEL
tara:strand:- start:986 stop:1219 length:234 start_codon:yes stop_codon:yes gene_type:complete